MTHHAVWHLPNKMNSWDERYGLLMVPGGAGALPVPRLQLLDIAQQETFDAGLSADVVHVTE